MDQGLHLIPNLGIALNFGVRLDKETVVPWVLLAGDRIRFVVRAEIPEDSRARRIGSADLRFAVQKAIQLIEICRLGYIGGNDLVVLAALSDTIHLNGKQYRKAVSFQFPRQRDDFGGAPAVSVEDNAGIPLLFGRED